MIRGGGGGGDESRIDITVVETLFSYFIHNSVARFRNRNA